MSSKDAFEKIYTNKIWGDGSLESPLSGAGSLASNAQPYVDFIQNVIETRRISSVVDFGHGDWEMWKKYSFEGVSYTGIDIVENLSKALQNSP
jgi:hypothetical protein